MTAFVFCDPFTCFDCICVLRHSWHLSLVNLQMAADEEEEVEEDEEEEGEAWAEEDLGEGEADRELTEEELQSATQVGCGLRMYVCVYFRLWSV